jgi:hypothetical protein
MLTKKQYQLFAIIISILFLSSTFAQKYHKESKLQLSIRFVPTKNDNSELLREIGLCFSDFFKSKNISVVDDANLELSITVKEISEKDEIIISLTRSIALPDNVINLAVENEAFYKDVSDKVKYPPEGKEIRRMITREFIYSYRAPWENEMFNVKRSELVKFCREYVTSFVNRYYNLEKEM